jgi:hypothetical protein
MDDIDDSEHDIEEVVAPDMAAETAVVRDQPTIEPNLQLAEPGLYWCDIEDPGTHPRLGLLQHGENDFSGVTDPEVLAALAQAVADGWLRKV